MRDNEKEREMKSERTHRLRHDLDHSTLEHLVVKTGVRKEYREKEKEK